MQAHAGKNQENQKRSVSTNTRNDQKQPFTSQFLDNRPEAITQRKLQETASNSSQTKKVTQLQEIADNHTIKISPPLQTKENNNTNVIQRRVALAKNAMTKNFVELTSIDYGINIAGGPVELLKDSNFSKMTEDESLAIVAHGGIGSSGEYSGDEIASFLTNDVKGLKKDIKSIRFTSCYAGKGTEHDDSDSVISVLKEKLATGGLNIPITGAMGPSIKSLGLGTDAYTVWDKNKTTEIASQADGKSGNLPANSVLESVLVELLNPQGYADKVMSEVKDSKDEQENIKNKAEMVRHATTGFYRSLVDTIEDTQNSWLIQGVISGDIKINDSMAKKIGTKWRLPNLTGEELKKAILGAAAHKNLLLEDKPIRTV
ncbi:hypothetical protein Q4Q34_14645 [Flavivirga abyssicola]|uniref:hypothetical protein n=1 Tax=Flavivirga abyssicola TaxID=3063533 RepID=UPI0026DECA3A|nr:hypothetical protein [Flavivirga sp. MEBiC07777]WVK12457.1 hypothetical protein Q4Q34_14645 [Flavivirga sp. MEBiC07777]